MSYSFTTSYIVWSFLDDIQVMIETCYLHIVCKLIINVLNVDGTVPSKITENFCVTMVHTMWNASFY